MREELNTRTALTSKNSYDQGILPWGRLKVLIVTSAFQKLKDKLWTLKDTGMIKFCVW